MAVGAARGWRSALFAPSGPGRAEALIALARACVLLFSAAALAVGEPAPPDALVAAHLVVAAISVVAVLPLSRLRTPRAAEWAGRVSLALDLALFAGYAVAVDGRPGWGTLYVFFVLLSGPVRWGVPGALVSGLGAGTIIELWPMPEATGRSMSSIELWTLIALLTLSVAALAGVWRRGGARLRQAHDQFEAAFEHASIGMALLDGERRILQANPSLAGLLGVSAAELRGSSFVDWAAGSDRVELEDALAGLSAGLPGLRAEVRFRRTDGSVRWGLVAASWLAGSAGVPPRIVAQVENVHSRKSAEARLEHQAQHDALTGLPNRFLLLARLESALAADDDLCLVFLDLDRFKIVNDGLGHAAGDRLLVEVAARLRAGSRPGDVVVRLGGDEFVVLCHGVRTEQEARAVAERVLSALRAPVRLEARSEVVPLASAGVALSAPGCTAETLLRDADTAMYGAKAAGGGRVRVFTPELHQAARRTHELEVDLRRALVEERLTLVYQPVVDLTTGRVVELEALLRWHDEVRGSVSPNEFIPVAEQSGLIDDLGSWVLGRALADAVRWPAGRHGSAPGVAVNVSPRQLLDPGFPAAVAVLLAEHGLEPARLWLELTETALVEDTRQLVPALRALREVGVRLAIDDFGTGHASLTYLAQLPVDGVKVDRSFVTGVADDAGSAAIVGGVVAMAGAFSLTVVAEGVETGEQLQRLRRLGVDRVQGFLLSEPLHDAAVHSVLTAAAAELVPPPRTATPGEHAVPAMDTPRRFRVLLEAARDITACVDLSAVLTTSFSALRKLVDFTGGSIQLVDGDVVRLAATDPPATPEALAASIPVGTGVSGGIAATGEPRYLPDITIAAAVTPGSRTRSTSAGVRSWYGVPLVAEGRVIGVLQVDSTEVDAFTDADRLLVLSFASVVAASVQTARLFAQEINALQQPPA